MRRATLHVDVLRLSPYIFSIHLS